MSLMMQCGEIRSLEEYVQEESGARAKNLEAFRPEYEMATSIFSAAQEVYAHLTTSDRVYWKVQASLLTAAIKYYATAVDLCLRGSPAEGIAIMRSSVEHAAYIVKIATDEALAAKWVDMDMLSKPERRKLFGTDSELMAQPSIKAAAASLYELFSTFGVHARVTAAEQTIDFDHPFGWRIRHAEEGTEHARFFLLAVVFAMRDLITLALVPSLLDGEAPKDVIRHLDASEEERKKLGHLRREFLLWIQDPKRPHAKLLVAGVSTVLVEGGRRRPSIRRRR